MTKNQLQETKIVLNCFIALAGLLLLISVFTTLYSAKGVIYFKTDDAGSEVGANYAEVFKVYNFVLPIKTSATYLDFFSWEMSLLYVLLILAYIMNFVDLGANTKTKQFIIGGALILFSLLLLLLNFVFKKQIDAIYDEWVSEHFSSSYINTRNGGFPFLAYSFGIFAGLMSIYKAWIVGKLELISRNRRNRV
ncbi:MAG: hypothetical protein WAP91_05955 [Bacilli bacterium]|jgi:hypothetical protein